MKEKWEAPGVVVVDEATKIVNPDTGRISGYVSSELDTRKFSTIVRRLEFCQRSLFESSSLRERNEVDTEISDW